MAGITDSGFVILSRDEIRKNITDKMIAAFSIIDATGQKTSIDISPSSRFGQLADIMSDELSLIWEATQAVYDSRYPDNASNINLDNVVSITNTTRRPAIPSNVSCFALSDNPNVTIPAGQAVSKDIIGDPEQFRNIFDISIGDDYIMLLPNDFPDEGQVQLSFQGILATDGNQETIDGETNFIITYIDFDDTAQEIKEKLEDLRDDGAQYITEVNVSGSLNLDGYVYIEFVDTTLVERKPAIVTNTLKKYNVEQDLFSYYAPSEVQAFQGTDTTGIAIPALSVRKVLSSNVNFNAVINPEVGTAGVPRESDADLRIRRKEELQQVGQVTPNGIKAKLNQIVGVTDVFLIENDTAFTDADGRPPHSFEVYCNCSEALVNEVGQAIYDSKPVGIGPYSSAEPGAKVTADIIDVNNNPSTVDFSRPTGTLFYIYIELQKTEFYPADGDTQIKNNLIKHFEVNYELQDTGYNKTVYIHNLFSPVNAVIGIGTCEIKDTITPPSDPSIPTEYDVVPITIDTDKFAYVTADSIYIKEVT